MKRYRFDVMLSAIVLAVYAANRWLFAFDAVLPASFARYHFNDLLAGVLFPAYANLLSLAVRDRPLVAGIVSALACAAVCSLAWEVLAPLVLGRGTPDLLDVACYFAGAGVYLLVRRAALGRGSVSVL